MDSPPPTHPRKKPFKPPNSLRRIPKIKKKSTTTASTTPHSNNNTKRSVPKRVKIPKRFAPPSAARPGAQKKTPLNRIRAADVHRFPGGKRPLSQFPGRSDQKFPKRVKSGVGGGGVRRPRGNVFFPSLLQPTGGVSSSVKRNEPKKVKKRSLKRNRHETGATSPVRITRKKPVDMCAGPDCTKKAVLGIRFCSAICKSTFGKKAELDAAKRVKKLNKLKKAYVPETTAIHNPTLQRAVQSSKDLEKSKRGKNRKKLATVVNPAVAKKIEKKLYKQNGGLVKAYFNKLIPLVQNLRHNKDLQRQLNEGTMSVSRLLLMNPQDMASKELVQEREAADREFAQERITQKKIVGLGKGVALLSERNDVSVIDVDLQKNTAAEGEESLAHDEVSSPTSSFYQNKASTPMASNHGGLPLVWDASPLRVSPSSEKSSPTSSDNDEEEVDIVSDHVITDPLPPRPSISISSSSSSSSSPSSSSSSLSSLLSISTEQSPDVLSVDDSHEPPEEIQSYEQFLEDIKLVDVKEGDESESSSSDVENKDVQNNPPKIAKRVHYSYDSKKPFPSTYEEASSVWMGPIRGQKNDSFLASLVQLSGEPLSRLSGVNPKDKGLRMKGQMDYRDLVDSLPLKAKSPEKHKLYMFILQPLTGEKNHEGYNKFARHCREKNRAIVFDLRKKNENGTSSGTVLYFFAPTSSDEKEQHHDNSLETSISQEFLEKLFGENTRRPEDILWCIGVFYVARQRGKKVVKKHKHRSRRDR